MAGQEGFRREFDCDVEDDQVGFQTNVDRGFDLQDSLFLEDEYSFEDVAMPGSEDGVSCGFLLSDLHAEPPDLSELGEDGFLAEASVGSDEPARPREWIPGKNIGNWIRRRWVPIAEQSQVLLCNLVLNLKKVPGQDRHPPPLKSNSFRRQKNKRAVCWEWMCLAPRRIKKNR